jgi:ElaB/YqjD/DUF883 family membrane-anchored ribosome-binding protein
MAETEINNGQSLVKPEIHNSDAEGATATGNDRLNEFRAQAQDYGQKLQEAAGKAREYATERFSQAGDKLKDLQNKNPQELVEEAKKYARNKPGEALLISAAVGLVVGLLLKGRR